MLQSSSAMVALDEDLIALWRVRFGGNRKRSLESIMGAGVVRSTGNLKAEDAKCVPRTRGDEPPTEAKPKEG